MTVLKITPTYQHSTPTDPTDEASTSQETPEKQPRLCYSDLGAFVPVDSTMSDNDKYHLIQEHFIPAPTYSRFQIDVLFNIAGL